MQDQGSVFVRIMLLALAVTISLSHVRGAMRSVLTVNVAGDDHRALREKMFAALRAECQVAPEERCPINETISCSFTTPAHAPMQFILKPISLPSCLNFKLMTPRDAHVSFAWQRAAGYVFGELLLGGWNNVTSIISPCQAGNCPQHVDEYHEVYILSAEEYRPFWIEYKDGMVSVGKGGQNSPILEAETNDLDDVISEIHVAIRSWREPGYWEFYQFCE